MTSGAGADGAAHPSWPDVLTALTQGQDLSADVAAWAMDQVMSGSATDAQLGGFLTALRAKGETAQEMSGLAAMMLRHAHRFEVPGPTVDIVGTGGDRAMTVNISTMSAVVMAAAGATVVKHGNRAASSRSGSADMLEALGIDLDLTPDQVRDVVAEAGITFCFALTFHPAMRYAGAVRRELGIGTAFNFLGPLTNPAQPRYAAVGCADPRMAPLMAEVFAGRGTRAVVFRGDDGLDEITSATTSTLWWAGDDGSVRRWSLDPRELGLAAHPLEALRGGDAAHNAEVARRLFDGEQGPVRDAVLLNAGTALALVAAGEAGTHPASEAELRSAVVDGMSRAIAALDDGGAARVVERWVRATR
ncbi:anthranilate phosphoribosyltransferase [Serinicoccus sp. CNJ-927]|uniref:anthranilate phosphoribosyltransferase n=1 Tax=unclassified Serinicoccus TaxID=2643101 RepID=UPI0009634C85|nr:MULTISPECIES: anthranilate phosphoribosyltransferase [unclassified Serinicoccus]OLT14767.1 anthranilate phosphoribosyltransferase [Serinicoccus sp. CUA-874]OLT39830.1 anthranilate phosphoribosyltransferase [Serinicoccus sp. CNJ-927]